MPTGSPLASASACTSSSARVRLQRAGRIVEQHAHGAELGQHLRALDQRLDLAGAAGAVDEAGLEVALGSDDRLGRLAQVRDVVERVVEPEDVDAVLGRRGDEAAREVGVDRTRADEEAAAERQAERRLDARLERADPLPRALDAALDGRSRSSRRPRPRGTRSRRGRGSRRAGAGRRRASRPASGSCPSRRIVVSARVGTRGAYRATWLPPALANRLDSGGDAVCKGMAGLRPRESRRSLDRRAHPRRVLLAGLQRRVSPRRADRPCNHRDAGRA